MKTPLTCRLIAAAGAAVTTWSLLLGVAWLGQPDAPAEVTLAHRPAQPQAAPEAPDQPQPPVVVVARNEPR